VRVLKRLKALGTDLVPINVERSTSRLRVYHQPPADRRADRGCWRRRRTTSAGWPRRFDLLFIDGLSSSDSIPKTLLLDKVDSKERR
jgi:hypothetical protein